MARRDRAQRALRPRESPAWDADEYFEHALFFAEPGGGDPEVVGPARRWQAWCATQAARLHERTPDLAALAERQGLVLRADQLDGLGITRGVRRRHVRDGTWSVPQPGLLAVLGDARTAPDPPRARHAFATAAALLANPGTAATHRSGAILRGLPTLAVPGRPEISAPLGPHGSKVRVSDLTEGETERWYGLAVTSAARTVVDCARLDGRDGIIVADAALREGLVDRSDLDAATARATRWRGVRQAREIVALADARSESPLESLTRLAIHDAGLPRPELQFPIRTAGRREPYRVDFCWPDRRLVLEADGRTKYRSHGSAGPVRPDDVVWREKKRETAIRRAHWTVERVFWADIVHGWPDTESWLRELLG